jgi:hypothetical protein
MLARGETPEQVTAHRVADLPEERDTRRCLELRAELGIARDGGAPAFVLPGGEPVPAAELGRWLRSARLVRTSLDVNGGICRSLLEIRHELAPDPEEVAP